MRSGQELSGSQQGSESTAGPDKGPHGTSDSGPGEEELEGEWAGV